MVTDCCNNSFSPEVDFTDERNPSWVKTMCFSMVKIYRGLESGNFCRGTGVFCSVKDETNEFKGILTAFHVLPFPKFPIDELYTYDLKLGRGYILRKWNKQMLRFIWFNRVLDTIFLCLKDNCFEHFDEYEFVPLSTESFSPSVNNPIPIGILHYPNGENLKYSFGHLVLKISTYQLYHSATIYGGSSGGPIFYEKTQSRKVEIIASCRGNGSAYGSEIESTSPTTLPQT